MSVEPSTSPALRMRDRLAAPALGGPKSSGGGEQRGSAALRRLFRNRLSIVGVVLLALVLLLVIPGPLVWTVSPDQQDLAAAEAPPSAEHPLGTDRNGRDVLARVMYGGRVSIAIALGAVVLATLVGGLIGLLAGFALGPIDGVLMRLMDIILAFPPLLLALAIVAAAGAGITNTAIAVAVPTIPFFARLMRSMVITVRERDYVLAARASGVRWWRVMTRHVLGNSLSPVIVAMALTFGLVLLEVAALGFLGLGVKPPHPEWGAMLSDARTYLLSSPVVVIAPGLAIAITALAVNLVGDALNDVVNRAS